MHISTRHPHSPSLFVLLACMSGLVGGCTKQFMIGDLLSNGQANEILAYEDYRGKTMRVTGEAADVVLQSFKRTRVDVSYDPGGYGATGTVSPSRKTFAIIALKALEGGTGAVTCYLSGASRRKAGHVKVGDVVTVVGTFRRYTRTKFGFSAQLGRCQIEEIVQ